MQTNGASREKAIVKKEGGSSDIALRADSHKRTLVFIFLANISQRTREIDSPAAAPQSEALHVQAKRVRAGGEGY